MILWCLKAWGKSPSFTGGRKNTLVKVIKNLRDIMSVKVWRPHYTENIRRFLNIIKKEKNEIKSSAHSRYRCQYHIVFAPKYRRQAIYGGIKKDIGEILRKLCEQKGVEIIEAEACVDHIHMLVSIPPHISIAQFMGYLKGKSSLMIFDRHANLKYKYGSRHFWCRGYYVDTVGRNKKVIA